MKIKKIQILPGREGDISSGRALNEYEAGKISFVRSGKVDDYEVPFGNPLLTKKKEIALDVHPLNATLFGVYYYFHDYLSGGEITSTTSEARGLVERLNEEEVREFINSMHYHLRELGDTIREMPSFHKKVDCGFFPYNAQEIEVMHKINDKLWPDLKKMVLENPELEVTWRPTYETKGLRDFDTYRYLIISGESVKEADVEIIER